MKFITQQDFEVLWNKDPRLSDANSLYLKLMGKNHPYFSRITDILKKIKEDPDEETMQNLYLDFVQYRKKIINDSKTLEL
jgi:hypothetical protein